MKRNIILSLALAATMPLHVMAQEELPEVPSIMQHIQQDSRFTTFAALLQATGYSDVLNTPYFDEEYIALRDAGKLHPKARQDRYDRWYLVSTSGGSPSNAYLPEYKFHNYTILAETDDVLAALGVKGATDSDLNALAAHLQSMGADGTTGNDWRSASNIVNRWVGYHIIPAKMRPQQLVVHYNELGYAGPNNMAAKPSIPVSEYYATMSTPSRLIKFTEGSNTDGIRVNRFSRLNVTDPLVEDEVYAQGLSVDISNPISEYAGYVYPLAEVLAFDNSTAQMMGSERMRFDVAGLVPELIAFGSRRPTNSGEYVAFPKAFSTHFYADDDMFLCYLPGTNSGWANMQGDEFNVGGQGSMMLQLPPVPATGEYELRVGVSASARRGVLRFTLVSDDGTQSDLGLPVDMRQSGKQFGYVADGKDSIANISNDVLLYTQGVMKAPASYSPRFNASVDLSQSLRNVSYVSYGGGGAGSVLRRVVGRMNLDSDRTYYLKMSSVIPSSDVEIFLDYIELCPESVYGNMERIEDKW